MTHNVGTELFYLTTCITPHSYDSSWQLPASTWCCSNLPRDSIKAF